MRSVLKRVLAVMLGLGVAFACAEVTLRLTQPAIDLKTLTGKQGGKHPMASWAAVDAFSAYRAIPGDYPNGTDGKTVNTHGFISTPEIAYRKPEGTVRVVFLGGSSTACNELSDEHTWPWRATEELRKLVPNQPIELINGALGGYTTFESYGRLWSRLRFFDPDIVVVYHGWNELYYFKDAADARRWRVPKEGGWGFDRPVQLIRIKPHWIDPYIEWSSVFCRIRRQWFSEPLNETGKSAPLASDFDPQGPQVFRQNLRLLLAAGEALGFETVVVKQATLITPELPQRLRDSCRYELHGFDHDAHVRAFAAVYDVIDDEVRPDRIVDATHLSGRERFFNDHIHLTQDGAYELGRLVASGLAPRVRSLRKKQ